jgi:hypothetical protein
MDLARDVHKESSHFEYAQEFRSVGHDIIRGFQRIVTRAGAERKRYEKFLTGSGRVETLDWR